MKMLADKGLHDIENESWNAYGQFTYISSWKPSFYAPYTNLNGSINSLLPTAERSFTGTATLYLGVRQSPSGPLPILCPTAESASMLACWVRLEARFVWARERNSSIPLETAMIT